MNNLAKPYEICREWLGEGRIICHEPISDNGEQYYCAHCSIELEAPND